MGNDTDRLVELLEEKGLWIKYKAPDGLSLCGPKEEQTADILTKLKACRPELLRRAKEEAGKRVAVPESKPQPVTAEIEAACEQCRATIFFPGASDGVFCQFRDCPHPRLGTVPQASGTAVYKKW